MARIDPLEVLKNRKNLLDSVPFSGVNRQDEQAKITIQLPRGTSNELKKLAIDRGISRNRLIYLLVRRLLNDPELLQDILRQHRQLDSF